MSIGITIAIQKGGAGKTTTTGCLSYILAQDHRVLMLDLDGQGNLTEMFFQKPVSFFRTEEEYNIFKAIETGDIKPNICTVNDNLHIVPGSDLISLFSGWLYRKRKKREFYTVIKDLIAPVQDYYDFILMDTPPALGDILLNSLTASDYVITIFETGQFCYSALAELMKTIGAVQKSNKKLKVCGILPTLLDARRVDNKDYIDMVQKTYGSLVFDTIIRRSAPTGRLAYLGFSSNPEVGRAVSQYVPTVEEILTRTKVKTNGQKDQKAI